MSASSLIHSPPSSPGNAAKRPKTDVQPGSNEIAPFVPAALRLVHAMHHINVLPSIGTFPSKLALIRYEKEKEEEDQLARIRNKHKDDDDENEDEDEDDDDKDSAAEHSSEEDLDEDDAVHVDEDDEEPYTYNPEKQRLFKERMAKKQRNKALMKKLGIIAIKHGKNCASGYLKPFHLRITRAGCEFDETVGSAQPNNRAFQNNQALSKRLRNWYKSAQISGYGDVRGQVTKIDPNVRRAREIPQNEFEVQDELLERIAKLWDEHFFPNIGIRVEPYKIHLYGPDDHFDPHRDTPEKDLVGTFIVGLGESDNEGSLHSEEEGSDSEEGSDNEEEGSDSEESDDGNFANEKGGLFVEGSRHPAHEAYWCAFYPDVTHSIAMVRGYRASISFKIFRTSDTDESKMSQKVRQQVADIVKRLEAPFGILLQHKYGMGTTQFSGFDALVTSAVSALSNVRVEQLPVVIKTHLEKDLEMTTVNCKTSVYPFTAGHVDALLRYTNSNRRPKSHAECGVPWLDKFKGKGKRNPVPFFSLKFDEDMFTLDRHEQEGSDYTGNEARPWTEDSVYVSYALVAIARDE